MDTMAFSPDSQWVAAQDTTNTIQLWSVSNPVYQEPAPTLQIKNLSNKELHFSLLRLAPDWSITLLDNYTFDYQPDDVEEVDFALSLNGGITEETDYYKLFITKASTDFRMLQLPPLDEEHTTRYMRSGMSSLEQLLAQFAEQIPTAREVMIVRSPDRAWNTVQIPLVVKRNV